MEALYFISIRQQSGGAHIIHTASCPLLPDREKTICLGIFNSPENALKNGNEHFRKSDYCPFCLKEDHIKRKKQSFIRLFAGMDLVTSGRIAAPWESSMVYGLN